MNIGPTSQANHPAHLRAQAFDADISDNEILDRPGFSKERQAKQLPDGALRSIRSYHPFIPTPFGHFVSSLRPALDEINLDKAVMLLNRHELCPLLDGTT